MHKIRVGVLRGGPSSEYHVSLKTGQTVLNNLPEKYQPIDIFIDKEGTWHIHGLPHLPHQAFKKVDLIFNAMHGEYGEDGKVQQILESHNVPFTGSGSFASALAMNKSLAKDVYKQHGIKSPYFKIIEVEPEDVQNQAYELFRSFSLPMVIKPLSRGSSIGVSIAKDFPSIERGLMLAIQYSPILLIEEYIYGREATVGVIDNFRNQNLYALLPVEISPPKENDFFDLDAKYSGRSLEICPGHFSEDEKHQLQEIARRAHQALGARHYSRSDFIVHPRRGIFILETNTLPGLTQESLFPKALTAIGSNLSEFLDHVLSLARERK